MNNFWLGLAAIPLSVLSCMLVYLAFSAVIWIRLRLLGTTPRAGQRVHAYKVTSIVQDPLYRADKLLGSIFVERRDLGAQHVYRVEHEDSSCSVLTVKRLPGAGIWMGAGSAVHWDGNTVEASWATDNPGTRSHRLARLYPPVHTVVGRVSAAHMGTMKNNEPSDFPDDAVGQTLRFGDSVAIILSGSVMKAAVVGWSNESLVTIAIGDRIRSVRNHRLVRLLDTDRTSPVAGGRSDASPRLVLAS
ncbi:hypothetical protein [Arthrobacter sp. A2-55]|uniref:hypothetical protein n=1 Tax=Arthrobacter sp. A2-55 TaxID=2897337 RepID=UPI0021CDA3D0|nr:hypothetical protein [Arthrobacter sp. A2-55]MCU6480486.1 hypothetical protein [Arthrobacter sp. A2-55]